MRPIQGAKRHAWKRAARSVPNSPTAPHCRETGRRLRAGGIARLHPLQLTTEPETVPRVGTEAAFCCVWERAAAITAVTPAGGGIIPRAADAPRYAVREFVRDKVERKGVEPSTSALRTQRSPN